MKPSEIRETELFKQLAPEIAETVERLDEMLKQLQDLCEPGITPLVNANQTISFQRLYSDAYWSEDYGDS